MEFEELAVFAYRTTCISPIEIPVASTYARDANRRDICRTNRRSLIKIWTQSRIHFSFLSLCIRTFLRYDLNRRICVIERRDENRKSPAQATCSESANLDPRYSTRTVSRRIILFHAHIGCRLSGRARRPFGSYFSRWSVAYFCIKKSSAGGTHSNPHKAKPPSGYLSRNL